MKNGFTYDGDNLKKIAFPLGGIGTGSVSLNGYGQLVDWEIFNRPNKGPIMPFAFFSIRAKADGDEPVAKVLQPIQGVDLTARGFGSPRETGAGLQHMESCSFRGEYPFATVDFKDSRLPVSVSLEAYNPFIPHDEEESGIPAAIFRFHVTNTGKKPVDVAIAANMINPIGYPGTGRFIGDFFGKNLNSFVARKGFQAISMTSSKYPKTSLRFGTMAIATTAKNASHQSCWFRSDWFDNLYFFWDEFLKKGSFDERKLGPSDKGKSDVGCIAPRERIMPGKTAIIPIFICWHFPNFEKYWCASDCKCDKPVWKNHYAKRFKDALSVAEHLAKNEAALYARTRAYHRALFDSSLPEHVIDAVSSQSSILKTTTCLRLPDGTFYGWEGCGPESGCCEGTCGHVWNYAQTMAYMFPALERTVRDADYKYNLHPSGKMCFRIQLPLGSKPWKFHPAADGQMGGILKLFRDWQLCGDDKWLRKTWPKARKALEYAWKKWDKDMDGVMEAIQHNTYDIEFLGPNTMMGTFYLAALKAGEEMALHAGDRKSAMKYRSVFDKGRVKYDKLLFNGEYYEQKYDPSKAKRFQYGRGCLADQMIGQWLAHMFGLGYVLDRQKVLTTMRSIFKHNWKTDFTDFPNSQRIYALGKESGLLTCTWPKGGRPAIPFPYSDEVWCGIEYQVAAHMIYEGMVNEGLAIAKGTRDRHDGSNRNPWNEFECGNHYARSLASYSLLTALSGFGFSAPGRTIEFGPRHSPNNFKSFFSTGTGWGVFKQMIVDSAKGAFIELMEGKLELGTIRLKGVRYSPGLKMVVYLGSKEVAATANPWTDGSLTVCLEKAVTVTPNEPLRIVVKD